MRLLWNEERRFGPPVSGYGYNIARGVGHVLSAVPMAQAFTHSGVAVTHSGEQSCRSV